MVHIVGAKILANPLSFLGVTSFFIISLYMYWLENGGIDFSIKNNIAFGTVYIIALSIFMDKDPPISRNVDNKIEDKVEIKQNNISLFSFFKNTKK